jgi:pimeloyl-ACP methyl ester carboxylesterase
MPRASLSSGIEIEYDVMGDLAHPPTLWIMGFTAQMIAWPDQLLKMFVDRGLCAIRFDNRDCGLSTKFDGVPANTDDVIKAALLGDDMPPVAYTLHDMAADARGVLDHLGIEKAHIIGASMGGMIAQTFALDYPERTLTLTSIMSQPGDPTVGQPTPEAAEALLSPPPLDRESYIAAAPKYLVWASKKYGDAEVLKTRAALEYDRCFYPEGAGRQLAAIYSSTDRPDRLTKLNVPTLVIHGRDDTLITPSGGERTAEVIPNAQLLMLDDMGHDLPEPLWPAFADAICSHIKKHS